MSTKAEPRRRFRAMHIDHIATMLLPIPVAAAMTQFTPTGKAAWLPEWKPEFLHRADDDAVDTAFRTSERGTESLWMVLDMSPEDGSIGYARIVPDSFMGTEMITGEAIDDTSCWVTVTTELTALTENGNVALKALTATVYQSLIEEWSAMIVAARA